ncbi:MAG: hypothetical protein ACI8V2_000504 [Candidatus Latescibacterota bacterium]|jgi:hypothetical protein
MADRKKIAAIVTAYYPRSHADVVVTKFLKGFPTDEGLLPPEVDVVSMYLDQVHERDIGREMAKEFGVPIYESIPQALTLGGKELAVDGVLIIGEHGDYAWNEKEQHMYPRKFFFEQVCGVFATSGRSVPVFTDKHLSYNWHDAKWMYDRAQELNVPFMAGSSVPLSWRKPWIEYDLDVEIDDALSMSYSGLDSYGFHALEALQCMVERRKGGETGIVAVQCLEGDAVWASDAWDRDLYAAAVENIEAKEEGDVKGLCENPALFTMAYADGLKTSTLMLTGFMKGWGYAARRGGQVEGMRILLPDNPHGHFSYLSLNIQKMFLTGKPQYPVERTLLITGALEALMNSRHQGHIRIETPHLDVSYRSYETLPIRSTNEDPIGASLEPFK